MRIVLLAAALLGLAACSPAVPDTVSAPPTIPSQIPSASPDEPACGQYPTPACTGVPKGTQLTRLKSNFYDVYRVTKDNTVLDAVHVTSDLLITAHNVTIRNSQIDGQVKDVYDGKQYSFTITDSTVGPTTRCDTAPGIEDSNFTATRVLIRGHGDGFSVSGDNVTVKDSYVLLCSNPGDHSDGIQTVGASKNLTFHHNTVDQRKATSRTSPVFLVDATQNVTVTDNLLIGGTYTIRLRAAPGAIARNNAVVNKAWDYGPADADCATTNWTGNTLVDIDSNYNITSTVGPLPCPS